MEYTKKTCNELKELCKKQNLSNYSKLKKEELIKLLSGLNSEPVKDEKIPKEQIKNKGTGAGGANTNKNGKSFEESTSNEERLLANGYVKKSINGSKNKFDYYLEKVIDEKRSILFLTQNGLKTYFQKEYNIELFRKPDEAYLIKEGDRLILKVLEKKNQNVEGSVDTKLLAGPIFIEEYKECLGDRFDVCYAFCISNFLKKHYVSDEKKYKVLRKILQRYNIPVLFGNDENYFETLDSWVFGL